MPTPYRGRVDLQYVIVNAFIDDIESSIWHGTVTERPSEPGFALGPVVAELLEGDHAGWLARAHTEIARKGTALLFGQEAFESLREAVHRAQFPAQENGERFA